MQEHLRANIERQPTAGRRILERIYQDTNDETGYFSAAWEGEDICRSLYLTPRSICVPEHLLSDDIDFGLRSDIRALYFQVFNGIAEELVEAFGHRPLVVVVDPDFEDRTDVVLCTYDALLLFESSNAWHFFWEDEPAMVDDLERWYAVAASRLQREIADTTNGKRTTL